MNNTKTVSTLYLQALLDYLVSLNRGIFQVIEKRIDQTISQSEEGRVPASDYQEMIRLAAELSGDPLLGLHLGEQIKPGYYGPLGYIAMSSTTLGDALKKHIQYQQVVSNHGLVEMHAEQNEASLESVRVTWSPLIKPVDRHVVENIFAAWVCFARWICGRDIRPIEVTFQHASNENNDEYQRVFECPVSFSHTTNSILITRQLLDQTLVQADQELKQLFEKKAVALTNQLRQEEDVFLNQLKIWMTNALLQGSLSLEAAAKQFQINPRALQRKLAQKQQNYKTILDTIRKELALSYICDGDLHLTELSFLLGFADQPSFQRAFKRWTNLTPGQYRQAHITNDNE